MVRQRSCRSHLQPRLSDHKPVSALFDVKAKVVDRKKQEMVYEEISEYYLDMLDSHNLQQVECEWNPKWKRRGRVYDEIVLENNDLLQVRNAEN